MTYSPGFASRLEFMQLRQIFPASYGRPQLWLCPKSHLLGFFSV